MRNPICNSLFFILFGLIFNSSQGQLNPKNIKFTRQGVQRMIFDEDQSITISRLNPENIIGLASMHPQKHFLKEHATIELNQDKLIVKSQLKTQTKIWLGGFNPFMSYTIDIGSSNGNGAIGYEFSDADENERFIIKVIFKDKSIKEVKVNILKNNKVSLLSGQSSAKLVGYSKSNVLIYVPEKTKKISVNNKVECFIIPN